MHCNQEQIEALLGGELVGPEQDAVLAHLRDCPGCRSYYRQLLAMEQALRADTDPVLDDLLPDIMNRVHATPQHRRRSPWLRAVMGMAACLVVVLGIYLVRQQAEKGRRLSLQRYFAGFLRQQLCGRRRGYFHR